MSKRRWTLVLVPHGSEPSRIVEVSYNLLRGVVAIVGVLVVLGLLVGYLTLSHTTDLTRTARLQQENASLAREIGELHGRLTSLADTLSTISQRDAHIRVLANLEPGHQATWVDYRNDNRAPLLFISGGEDHLMPPSVQRSNAKHYKSNTITEVKEYEGRAHLLPAQEGWEEVADYALDWALANATHPAAIPADRA